MCSRWPASELLRSDVCDGGVVRTDRHGAGEREKYDLGAGGSACICWWLLKPITGQAPPTAGTSEWAKESIMFYGINKHYGARTRARYLMAHGTGDLEDGHVF
jgi:hypothetical protein